MHLIFVSEYGIKVKMHAAAFEKLRSVSCRLFFVWKGAIGLRLFFCRRCGEGSVFGRAFFVLAWFKKNSTNPTAQTSASVAGYESHTPVIFQMAANRKVQGMMTTSPRSSERICAGSARSTEVKYAHNSVLPPTNAAAKKYSRRPCAAISPKAAFPSPLKMAAMGAAKKKTAA